MNSDFKRSEKLSDLVVDILHQCASIKLSANHQDGATARWIEREMEKMINKVQRYLDD